MKGNNETFQKKIVEVEIWMKIVDEHELNEILVEKNNITLKGSILKEKTIQEIYLMKNQDLGYVLEQDSIIII